MSANDSGGTEVVAAGGGPALGALRPAVLSEGSGGPAQVAAGGGPHVGAEEDSLGTYLLGQSSEVSKKMAEVTGIKTLDVSDETPTELRKLLDVNPVGESSRVSNVMIQVTGAKATDVSDESPTELRKLLDVNPVGESTRVSNVKIQVTGAKATDVSDETPTELRKPLDVNPVGESTRVSNVMIQVTGAKATDVSDETPTELRKLLDVNPVGVGDDTTMESKKIPTTNPEEPEGSRSRRITPTKKMKPQERFGFGNLNWGVKAFKKKTPEERDVENHAILAKSGRVHSDELKTFDGAPDEMLEELNRRGKQAVADSLNEVYNKYRNASFLKREIEVMLLTGGRGSKGHLQAQGQLEIIQKEIDPLIMHVRSVFPKFSAPPHLLIEPFVEPKTPKK